jgi:hypothetical protein
VTKLSPAGNSLVYSTYLGGSRNFDSRGYPAGEVGTGIAVDSAGSAYVTGGTSSADFPSVNPFQAALKGSSGDTDAFVTKLSPTGHSLIYSTYLGGSGNEQGWGIAVDGAGSAYITGDTYSTDFPTANPFQATFKGSSGDTDAFMTKLSPAGNSLVYSTYLGGSSTNYTGNINVGTRIAVDSAGSAYVTGYTVSADFPTANPFQAALSNSNGSAFVTKLSPAGNSLVYSTYLGGSGSSFGDFGFGIAVDSAGSAYVTGYTGSADFPTANAFQTSLKGFTNAFVTKLNPAGNSLVYSTYLGGGSEDIGDGIAVDSAGNAYVIGYTYSADFPTANAFQGSLKGFTDAFVAKIGGGPSCSPASVPTNLSVSIDNGTASATWLPPVSDGGCPITDYIVSAVPAPFPFGPNGNNRLPNPEAGQISATVGPTTLSATLSGLVQDCHQRYVVSVWAETGVGLGPPATSASLRPSGIVHPGGTRLMWSSFLTGSKNPSQASR